MSPRWPSNSRRALPETDLAAGAEHAAGLDEREHFAGRRVDGEGHRATSRGCRAGSASARPRAGCALDVAVGAGPRLEIEGCESAPWLRSRPSVLRSADRPGPQHLVAARPARSGLAEAPVAQAVGTALQIDFAVAKDDRAPRPRPLLAQAPPREHEDGLAEDGERPARIGPWRVLDPNAAEVNRRLQSAGKRHPHRVEVDVPSRAGGQYADRRAVRATTAEATSASTPSTATTPRTRATTRPRDGEAASRRTGPSSGGPYAGDGVAHERSSDIAHMSRETCFDRGKARLAENTPCLFHDPP